MGAESVEWHLDRDSRVRLVLEVSGPQAGPESEVFAAALAELVGPVGRPRYLAARHVREPTWHDAVLPLATVRPTGVVWHAVPTVLGVRAAHARAFEQAWRRWVGGGPVVYTARPEGAGLLAAARGQDPLDPAAVLRLGWR